MNDFPKELVEITEFLATQTEIDIKSSGKGEDGRMNSAEMERKIIKLLENQSRWKIENSNSQKNNNRSWYDLGVFDKKDKKLFVNIKISTCNSVDNTSCARGIYYVFTGKEHPANKPNIISKIKKDRQENSNDYYFLIIKKPTRTNNNIPNAFLCSLKTLRKIKRSGSNLPFQCNWGDNVVPQHRSYQEAYNFILKSYGKSLLQHAKRYTYFKKSFPCIAKEVERGMNEEFDL